MTGGGSVQASLSIASEAVFNPPSATFTVNDVDVINNGDFSTTTALTVTSAAFTHGSTGTFSATTTSLTLSTASFVHQGGTRLEITSLTVPSASSFTMANERYYPFASNFGALSVGGTYTSQRISTVFMDSLTVTSGGNATHAANTTQLPLR